MSTTMTETAGMPAKKAGLGWQIGIWLAQILLAAGFGMAGGMKLFTPYAQLAAMAEKMHGAVIPEWLMHFIGTCEVLGAIGLILPALTRVLPILTPWAGVGLATIMVLATGLHVSRGEYGELSATLPLLALSAFVAWGRFAKAPIRPRGN